MRAEGLEPPRAFAHRHLKPACLPNFTTPADAARHASTRCCAAQGGIVCSEARMAEWTTADAARIYHPNRGKASSKTTKAIVVLLILVSVVLILVVTIGGWEKLAGAKPLQIAYIIVYLVLAFFIARWTRGGLPLVGALAILLGIFAAVARPGWIARDSRASTTRRSTSPSSPSSPS